MSAIARISTTEYGEPVALVDAIAKALGVDDATARRRVRARGLHLAKVLRLSGTPFSMDGNDVRVGDVAGLIRVAPRVELEVAPKFLDVNDQRWREDFFYIAVLSAHGRVLASETVGASPTRADDLATLVARAFVTMYWTNHRRPLRTYRRARIVDFALDGDADVEDLLFPDDEGFEQRVITYDRSNRYNAAIVAAARTLLPEVREAGTRRQLARLVEVLSPQRTLRRIEDRRLPSRARRWQALHDLSIDVLQGLGLAYEGGRYGAPGYVLDTAKAWEDLITVALRLGFGSANTRAQRGIYLARRVTPLASRKINVRPDVVLTFEGRDRVVLDAKYKGRADDRLRAVDEDLYQALAFARASGCRLVILLYPHRGDHSAPIGSTAEIDHDETEDAIVVRASVVARGISTRGGLRTFATNLARAIRELVAKYGEPLP